MTQLCLLCHYYITIIRIIFPIIFPIMSRQNIMSCIISLLYHYYTYYFTINSDYIRLCHPNFQEQADAVTVSRPMRRAMTDKCPGAAAKLWDDQASSLCEAKSTYSGEQ